MTVSQMEAFIHWTTKEIFKTFTIDQAYKEFLFDSPTPAWAVIQGNLKYKITPQMFNMQRIYNETQLLTEFTKNTRMLVG